MLVLNDFRVVKPTADDEGADECRISGSRMQPRDPFAVELEIVRRVSSKSTGVLTDTTTSPSLNFGAIVCPSCKV